PAVALAGPPSFGQPGCSTVTVRDHRGNAVSTQRSCPAGSPGAYPAPSGGVGVGAPPAYGRPPVVVVPSRPAPGRPGRPAPGRPGRPAGPPVVVGPPPPFV